MPKKFGRGRERRDFKKVPRGSHPNAPLFDLKLIDRSRWSKLIAAQQANEAQLSQMVIDAGLRALNQNGTNYCWANAVVNCVRVLCVAQSRKNIVDLSPASVAATVKNFQNKGGLAFDALEFIAGRGVASASLWPPNAWQVGDAPEDFWHDAANREDARSHIVQAWMDLGPPNIIFEQVATCLLLGIPIALGYDAWEHEICALDLVESEPGSQKFGIRIWNSWGDRGNWPQGDKFGMAVLWETDKQANAAITKVPMSARPEDAVALLIESPGNTPM